MYYVLKDKMEGKMDRLKLSRKLWLQYVTANACWCHGSRMPILGLGVVEEEALAGSGMLRSEASAIG